jgi:hypothetical protein
MTAHRTTKEAMHATAFSLHTSTSIDDDGPVHWALAQLDAAARTACSGPLAIELKAPSSEAAAAVTPAESFTIRVRDSDHTRPLTVTIEAGGERGFTYAMTEIAQRIQAGDTDSLAELDGLSQEPAVAVRGIQRNFSSVREDAPWFHDRAFWVEYLDFLANQRFNRFQLAFGMQYNYGTGWESRTATDNYLVFPYPFLVDVPGFSVRAQGVSNEERDRNMTALAFIAAETKRRGMSFQLGIWNHAYDFAHDSEHWYPILGISPETHAAYSAAALKVILTRIPEIDGVTFRVHHEGGIHEEGHGAFWGTVFDAASEVGRPLDIDMHAKGVDDELLDAADKPNLRTTISPKYWAEHMGLPYHQASIRPHERKPLEFAGKDKSITGVTDGDRRFTRYGYADFLSEDRRTDIVFRMWPGTQKLLLWGDPAMAAGFGRYATIGGSRGVEFCEPLTFKGRRGTGEFARHDPYIADDLRLGVHDWRKYRYTYALWGRFLFAPDENPAVHRRVLDADYGGAAAEVEHGLAALSRILPLVTVVHGVSGANNFYSPEMYVDLPISAWKLNTHYAWDTPRPAIWENVSPFDPTLFYGVGEYADAVMRGDLSPKYTPLEIAAWIEAMVEQGRASIAAIGSVPAEGSHLARAILDMQVLTHLGAFFAGKFRASLAYAMFRRTGDTDSLREAIELLAAAHSEYSAIAAIVRGRYHDDIAFGVGASDRGTWADRIQPMREDLHLLRMELDRAPASPPPAETRTMSDHRASRWIAEARFVSSENYRRGEDVTVCLSTSDEAITTAVLHYRHLNQAEDWIPVAMRRSADGFVGVIPGTFSDSPFPLQYFAEVCRVGDSPVFVPAFDTELSNQPYIIVYSDATTAS